MSDGKVSHLPDCVLVNTWLNRSIMMKQKEMLVLFVAVVLIVNYFNEVTTHPSRQLRISDLEEVSRLLK